MTNVSTASSATHTPRLRRTQAERTADTRARVIEAAITCLHEKGYASTTTLTVVEQAGLSRGAMLHHFGTKTDLIRAVLDHVLSANRAFYATRLGRIADPRARFLALPDLLWELAQTPDYMAVIEICMATRNDPDLGEVIRQLREQEATSTRQGFLRVAADAGIVDKVKLRTFENLVNCAFAGMAVFAAIYGGFDPLKGVLGELRRSAETLLPPEEHAGTRRGAKAVSPGTKPRLAARSAAARQARRE